MHFIFHLPEIIKSSLTITCLVMLMLLLIEFINVSSSGKLLERMQHRPIVQIIIATLLGLIPGCLGGFTIVSLYTHQLLGFGALVAGMISTFGDEAFIIFACSPKATLLLIAALVVTAILAGIITHYIFHSKNLHNSHTHTLEIHNEHDETGAHQHGKIQLSFQNIKKISFSRAVLLFGLITYLIAVFTGTFSHEHGAMPDLSKMNSTENHAEAHHESCCEHHHHDAEKEHHSSTLNILQDPSQETLLPYYHCDNNNMADEEHHHHGILSWENIIFILIALFTLIIVAFAPEHFLQEHLWEHVIKKHFISILLWTFGVLFFLHLLYFFVDVNAFVANNKWTGLVLLFLAVLIGIIPESGPHLMFVVMYFSGAVPFSILLASSVVQDGHGALPLLAYSRRNFLLMKTVNMFFGLLVGFLGYFIGF